ncbi:hypothetical protein AB0L63_28025 [Nocardia sp. NPDC051990]|uniref:hypothetical protein n=1 Tax=Nocardia sp. NPDC051990 TaxID=3155285 RepID=UPI003440B2D9
MASALGLTGTVPDEPPEPMLPATAVSDEASASNDPPPLFDPTRRSVKAVLICLRGTDPGERDRVLAIERRFGEAGSAILSRYQRI